MATERFPFDIPNNTDSIQMLLYRIASQQYLNGGGGGSGGGGSPGVRGWGAFQQTIAGGSSYTAIQAAPATQVYISNLTGEVLDISQDGVNYFRLPADTYLGHSPSAVTIYVKESTAEILIKRDDGGAAVTLDVLYFI